MLSNSVAELNGSVAEFECCFSMLVRQKSVAEWTYLVADFAQAK